MSQVLFCLFCDVTKAKKCRSFWSQKAICNINNHKMRKNTDNLKKISQDRGTISSASNLFIIRGKKRGFVTHRIAVRHRVMVMSR